MTPLALYVVLLAAPPSDADRQTLLAAGVNPDDPTASISYLRKRTLGPDEQARLQETIVALGAEQFADREKASRAILGFGPAAASLLRQAVQQHPDPEVQHRASTCLQTLNQVPHARVAAAAVRVVVAAASTDAAAVLLGFLPAADDRNVAAEVRAGLEKLTVRDGVANPVVVAALSDSLAVRRQAAASALMRVPSQRQKLLAAAIAETETDTRFQILFGLATLVREKAAVGLLVELLPRLNRGRQWQIEDFLLQLAGEDAPVVPLGRYSATGDSVREAWLAWWKGAGDAIDLNAVKYVPRTTGGLMLVTSTGAVEAAMVREIGPDLDERWRLPVLSRLADVRPLPDGTVHVGERIGGGYRVSVFDPVSGAVVRSRKFTAQQPNIPDVSYTQAHPLPDGGVLLVGPGEVVEYAADPGRKTPVFSYTRNQKLDIASACRLPDGRTLVIVKGGPAHGLFLDRSGAEQPEKTLAVADPQFLQSVQTVAVSANRVLIVEPGRLSEYDLDTGKRVWFKATGERGIGFRMTHGVQRLPTGNTLYVESVGGTGRVVEVNRAGDEVWSYTPPGSQVALFRAFQR